MMFGNHITRHLTAYLHGELPAELKARVEEHLRECARCREAYEEIRFAARMASLLTTTPAPDAVWAETPRRSPRKIAWAAATVAVAALSWMLAMRIPPRATNVASWTVTSVRGTPRIENALIPKVAELRTGETLRTDGVSEAEVQIANIGRLTIDPNTRIRLVITKSDEHRIALEHGKVEAVTWAPPRLFIVDTPSAQAVDLGCIYTLDVQKDGSSLLHVTLGMVSLANHGRESFVPAHDFARTRPGFGPGTPFHEDSSEEFKAALDAIDFRTGKARISEHVDRIVSEAHARDAATLWHLFPRIEVSEREKVYDQLAKLMPPPSGVTREGILALDTRMLRAWGEAIPELWWMIKTP